jgi:hypothetical protein
VEQQRLLDSERRHLLPFKHEHLDVPPILPGMRGKRNRWDC